MGPWPYSTARNHRRGKKDESEELTKGLLFFPFPPDGEGMIYLDRSSRLPCQPDPFGPAHMKGSIQGCHPIGSPRGAGELSWAFYGGKREPYEQSNKVDW